MKGVKLSAAGKRRPTKARWSQNENEARAITWPRTWEDFTHLPRTGWIHFLTLPRIELRDRSLIYQDMKATSRFLSMCCHDHILSFVRDSQFSLRGQSLLWTFPILFLFHQSGREGAASRRRHPLVLSLSAGRWEGGSAPRRSFTNGWHWISAMRKSPGLVGGDKILFSESELLLCKAVVSCY